MDNKLFIKEQQDVVIKFGAILSVLDTFLATIKITKDDNQINSEIRKIEPIVGAFLSNSSELYSFFKKYNYTAYFKTIGPSLTSIINYLAFQTLPSKRQKIERFIELIEFETQIIREGMLSVAQILTLNLDINVKANNPFSAYTFLRSLISKGFERIIIIDPYIDYSVFYRYLEEVDNKTEITVISDKNKLRGERLNKYQDIESLFIQEYPKYSLKLLENLHDRYVLTNNAGYNLGGSIKDCAKNSDFSIIQISEKKRLELIKNYT
jgi:hypothetical protein